MKLYDVPRNTWVIGNDSEQNCYDTFKFGHIDGMYSYCHDKEGNLCHYVAWLEVEICDEENRYDVSWWW